MLPLTSVRSVVGRHRQCRHSHRVSTFIGHSSQFVVYINYYNYTETHAANLDERQHQ